MYARFKNAGRDKPFYSESQALHKPTITGDVYDYGP